MKFKIPHLVNGDNPDNTITIGGWHEPQYKSNLLFKLMTEGKVGYKPLFDMEKTIDKDFCKTLGLEL